MPTPDPGYQSHIKQQNRLVPVTVDILPTEFGWEWITNCAVHELNATFGTVHSRSNNAVLGSN